MSKVRLALGLLLCGLVVMLSWLFGLVNSRQNGAAASQSSGKKGETQYSPPAFSSSRDSPTKRDLAFEREALLQGIVVGPDGRPVEGAQVYWIALQPEDLELSPPWPMASWGVLRRVTVAVTADRDGSFMFHEKPLPELSFGSTLIACHAGHYPGGLDLAVDSSSWPSFAKIVLEPAAPVEVLVIDSEGRPQAGATTWHAPQTRESTPQGSPVAQYERCLAQFAVTDANGRVEMAPFLGEQAFWAEAGGLVSQPWSGLQPSKVVLTLETSFTIDGSLVLPNWDEWDPNYRGERRVLVSGQAGNLWRPLARLRDVEEGEWGPLRVPLGDSRRFQVRLEGAPIVPIERVFNRPKPSEHLRFDFVAERLAELWLFVQDEQESPITTAVAEARWEGQFGANRVEGAAKPDGYLYLGTFPPGSVHCRVWAPGYGPASLQAVVPISDALIVDLKKGGRLHGRCVHDGKPVNDFEIIYTNEGTSRYSYSKGFLGREDGSFEIDSLGAGDWAVYAASPIYPSSNATSVSMSAGGDKEILLELPAAIRGGGRIVDSEGNPVPSARVQPYSSGGMEPTFPWGPPAVTAADGTFELEAFVLGTNWLIVDADEFARTEIKAFAKSQEFLEWGDILLFRPQVLKVSLIGTQGVQFSELYAYSAEGYILPRKHFDADGIVRFEGVPPGDLRLLISSPDDSFARLHLKLEPGKEWNYGHKVSGERYLEVRVVGAEGKPLSPPPNVYLSAQEETGVFVLRWAPTTEEGLASFEGLRTERAQILVFDSMSKALATRDVSFGANARLHVDVRVGDEPVRVRVVDAEGAPIPGTWVTMRSANGSEILAVDDTGAEGWAELFVVNAGPVLLDAKHGIAGQRQGIAVDASIKEHEVVLEAGGSLELRLVDGEDSLGGVSTRIETTGGVALSLSRETDAQGRVLYEPLGQGSYHIACRRADCWPVVVDQELSNDEHLRTDVQMRRLGGLELTVFNAEGLPVSGVEVDLSSDEFGVAVAAWLEEEKIKSSTGLRTDGRGQIQVEGLPRGPYAWSVSIDGGMATGSFDLKPNETNDIAIRLAK